MRGLKRVRILALHNEAIVASFTDAWIETLYSKVYKDNKVSHLLQMRGLKQSKAYAGRAPTGRIFYRCVD